jgi:glycosyltransferase involved in cell wall biosynthesis
MKITLLTNGFYPFGMGGMQKHSYYLARYLAKKSVQVDVYYFKSRGSKEKDLEKFFAPEELKYLTFYELDFPSSVYFPGHYIFNSYRYSCNIYKKFKEHLADTDFVYVQGFSGWKLLNEKESGKKIPPVGINFHGLEMFQIPANTCTKLENNLFSYPTRSCLQKADIAFSLGGKLTGIIKSQVRGNTKIWETPIGIEEKWLRKEPSATKGVRKFIFIGRYERRKGIQELNKAITIVNKEYDFEFEFIGHIPSKNRLKLLNCHYHGPIYDEDKIIELTSDGDILVSPSYSEGMPTVILEAMSRRLAVIATDVGAVSELVSSETGWLIEPANLPQLEAALVKAINIPNAQLQQKKDSAFRLIEKKFTWSYVIDITLDRIKNHVNKAYANEQTMQK